MHRATILLQAPHVAAALTFRSFGSEHFTFKCGLNLTFGTSGIFVVK
jgi:hypothetical protein